MALVQLLPEPVQPRTGGIDHATVVVGDYQCARRFYERALRPLGLAVLLDWPDGSRAHFGRPQEPSSLWLRTDSGGGAVRLALAAPDRASVDAFYRAALACGGWSLDPPRIRHEHTGRTYAASVVDPDGNAVEAICWNAS